MKYLFLFFLIKQIFQLITISQSDIPYSATTPNEEYRLSESVACGGTDTCITFESASVNSNFDLNGNQITFDNTGTGGGLGVRIRADNFKITNGNILQGSQVPYDSGGVSTGVSSGGKNNEISYLTVTVHGYDTIGIAASSNYNLEPDLVNEFSLWIHHNTIYHYGTHLSSRDGFTSEPLKISMPWGTYKITYNKILSSPQAGMMIGTRRGDIGHAANDGCSDGSVIAYNTITVDNSLYANNGGIHHYYCQGIDIHHNTLNGEGMEGIQIDHGQPGPGNRITIRDNYLNINCKYWPRGHSAGAGALQGIRLRYGIYRTDVYNNYIRVKANANHNPQEIQNLAWGIYASGYDGTFDDFNCYDNYIECIGDGIVESRIGSCIGMKIDGVNKTDTLEIYNNTIRSNYQVLVLGDIILPDEDGDWFHDNVLDLVYPHYNGLTLLLDYGDAEPSHPFLRNTYFLGNASKDDYQMIVSGGYIKEVTYIWILTVTVYDSSLQGINGASVSVQGTSGTQSDSTNSEGIITFILKDVNYRWSNNDGGYQNPTEFNPYSVTVTYSTYSFSKLVVVDCVKFLSVYIMTNESTEICETRPELGPFILDSSQQDDDDDNNGSNLALILGILIPILVCFAFCLILCIIIIIIIIVAVIIFATKKEKSGHKEMDDVVF